MKLQIGLILAVCKLILAAPTTVEITFKCKVHITGKARGFKVNYWTSSPATFTSGQDTVLWVISYSGAGRREHVNGLAVLGDELKQKAYAGVTGLENYESKVGYDVESASATIDGKVVSLDLAQTDTIAGPCERADEFARTSVLGRGAGEKLLYSPKREHSLHGERYYIHFPIKPTAV